MSRNQKVSETFAVMGRSAAATLAIIMATGCAGTTNSDTQAADREALGVCVSFYEITDDIKAGIINDSDADPRLTQVWQDARSIDNQAVRNGIAALLAARNNGDPQGPAVRSIDTECLRLSDKYSD